MGSGSGSWIFIVLLFIVFLCVAQKSSARQLVEHENGPSTTSSSSSSTTTTTETIHMHHHDMESTEKIFFTMDDLKKGKSLPVYFSTKSPSKHSTLLSLEEANTIPFSSSQLPYLLQLFSFSQHSPQAQAMNYTLSLCELQPIQGETKLCATSLESMLDFTRAILGLDTNLTVLTTTFLTNPTTKPFFQNYTVLEAPREVFAPRMVACHSMPYPYAVFYCHSQESENKVFEISMEGREDGRRVKAVGVCHMDTSHWDRDHVSFRLLNIKPGTSPVCHVFPPDNLVWLPETK